MDITGSIVNADSNSFSVNAHDIKTTECEKSCNKTSTIGSLAENTTKRSKTEHLLISENLSAEVTLSVAMKTLTPKTHVPLIEETINFEHHKDYLDRFFTVRYCIDVNQKYNDFCVLVHSNKVCVVTLAPSHPLLREDIEIRNINFQVSKNINRLDNKTSGKHKRHAQNVNQTAPLCFVECADDKVYTIYSTIPGKLLEMNHQLENNPQKIRECSPKFYHKQCYIAIILPGIHHTIESLNKNFLTPEGYEKAMLERVTSKKVEC